MDLLSHLIARALFVFVSPPLSHLVRREWPFNWWLTVNRIPVSCSSAPPSLVRIGRAEGKKLREVGLENSCLPTFPKDLSFILVFVYKSCVAINNLLSWMVDGR